MISVRQTITYIAAMISIIMLAQAAIASSSKLIRVSTTTSKWSTAKAKPVTSKIRSTKSTVSTDRQLLREARILFEKKNYEKALALYDQIPQSSDYWVEALEERAWAHVHLKEHDQALANLKTLFAPPVKFEIGAEPYLLSTLIQLRLCNYNELFKVMKRFKDDIRPRHEALQALAKTGESEASVKMIGRSIEAGQMSRATAGVDLPNLPRLFYRDAKMQDAFKAMLKPGASDRFANIVTSRMKSLAQRDVKETETILRKMHLIEVEAVSRIYSEQNLADAKKTSAPIHRDANTLVFPDDDKDVWLDELDSYQVNAKGCPAATDKTVSVSTGKGPKS
jgi:tetratricopeptide (TPR) repeat protein